ncbi:MAG TPA: NAD(+) synthase [Clostridiaceae bacterium]|nr:NAD(+) synthase [Clostridiaceae bacterium]
MNNTIINSKKLGYFRVAGATPEIKVADVDFNLTEHLQLIRLAEQEQIDLLVFPDFSLTGVTCQDLFKQGILLEKAKSALGKIKEVLAQSNQSNLNILMTIPEKLNGKLVKVLYFLNRNTAIKIMVPAGKSSALSKYFASGDELITEPTGEYLMMKSESVFFLKSKISGINFSLGIYQSIEDLYKNHSNKAFIPNINVVMSSSPELIENQTGTEKYLRAFAQLSQSGLVYLSPGYGESTTDHIYAGRGYIFEQDCLLAATKLYESDLMIGDLDLQIITNSNYSTDRNVTYSKNHPINSNHVKSSARFNHDPIICLDLDYITKPTGLSPAANKSFKPNKNTMHYGLTSEPDRNADLYRKFSENPFLPEDSKLHKAYFDSVLNMAAQGLRKRLEHINNPQVILGLSGGLDSTLALLIAVRTQKFLKKSNQNILCVSMPGFGTTGRTYNNAKNLADACNTSYLEISITAAAEQHFKDINHDPNLHDVTYENAQARERTQILMDLANQRGGIVLGTGDLSESALGFVTYSGDHMSMYHINAGIPKTLVRHLIEYEAKNYMAENFRSKQEQQSENLAKILFDILATPVSPELLPPEQGKIAQQTEHLIGPYELHDLFLYYFIRYQFAPRKILFIAGQTFGNKYDRATIIKWLKLFYKRFFANQFKRSASPDGPIISQIALSPRQGFVMPSDAVVKLWIEDLERQN